MILIMGDSMDYMDKVIMMEQRQELRELHRRLQVVDEMMDEIFKLDLPEDKDEVAEFVKLFIRNGRVEL